MKKCPDCRTLYPFAETACPACGFSPAWLSGFPAYAPALSRGEHAFGREGYGYLASVEEKSFWFQARNRLIVQALRAHCGGMESLLEIGCGTGFVLAGLRRAFPGVRLCGSEISTEGLAFAAERLPDVRLLQMDVRDIPFVEEFDVVGAFDVLEHLAEDEAALGQIRGALKPRGFLALTVPQHRWLWSAADEQGKHFRRYGKNELHGKLARAGFQISFSTSFVALLLPAMVLSRLFSPKRPGVCGGCELDLSPWLNAVCSGGLRLEESLIRRGLRLPFGGSRLVVAQKAN